MNLAKVDCWIRLKLINLVQQLVDGGNRHRIKGFRIPRVDGDTHPPRPGVYAKWGLQQMVQMLRNLDVEAWVHAFQHDVFPVLTDMFALEGFGKAGSSNIYVEEVYLRGREQSAPAVTIRSHQGV